MRREEGGPAGGSPFLSSQLFFHDKGKIFLYSKACKAALQGTAGSGGARGAAEVHAGGYAKIGVRVPSSPFETAQGLVCG